MGRPHMPRSKRVIKMILTMYEEGPSYARELRDAAGLPSSRWVYPYLRYWILLGFITIIVGIYGNLYRLAVRGRMLAQTLLMVMEIREPDEANLRILLRRLQAKGLRDRIYRDVVRVLYYMVKDKDNTPYVRAKKAGELAELFLAALRDKGYTKEDILRALEQLAEAGVLELNRPTEGRDKWAVAFTHGFTRGLGIPAAPVKLGPGPPPRGRRRK